MVARRKVQILDQFGEPIAQTDRLRSNSTDRLHSRRGAQDYFEGAETTRLNERAWRYAGVADANKALLPQLDVLRNRCKYEIDNNGYAAGIVRTYIDDLVGQNGPTLQINVEGDDRAGFAARVEDDWRAWCETCDASSEDHLIDVLRMQWASLMWAGDYGRQYITGPDAVAGVKLKFLPIAPERIATPLQYSADPKVLGGVETDGNGRPLRYFVLNVHPGALAAWADFGKFAEVPARDFLLVLRRDEAGQTRGKGWLFPSIDDFSQIRHFCQDTRTAARVAAMLAGFLYSDHPGAEFEELTNDIDGVFDLDPGTVTALPSGWRFAQTQPNQPTTQFKDFKREMLSEAGRPLGMPWLRIGCDAQGHTFSSARLDMNAYWSTIRTTRGMLERKDLNRGFARWFAEWRLSPSRRVPRKWSLQWGWEPAPSVDPRTDEDAAQKRMDSGRSCLRDECVLIGKDWEDVTAQRAKELQRRRELGLPEPVQNAKGQVQSEPDPATADSQPGSDEPPTQNSELKTPSSPVPGRNGIAHRPRSRTTARQMGGDDET